MTLNQEKQAEAVIQLHKDNDSLVDKDQLNYHIKFDTQKDDIIILAALEELGILEYQNSDRYMTRLTEYGWKFPGFEAVKLTEKENTNKETLIKDLTINQLKGNIFQMKLWWVLLLINVFTALIISNFTTILAWFGLVGDK